MALITGQELADHLHLTYDEDDDSLSQAVTMAGGIVKAFCNQELEEDTFTHKLDPLNLWVVMPQRPVTAITSVTTAPSLGLLSASDWTWDGVSPWLKLPTTANYELSATVVYTAGYSTIPDVIKAVTLAVAGRMYSNPKALRSEQIDDYSRTYAGGDQVIGLGLLPSEERLLRRYRLTASELALSVPRMYAFEPDFS